MTAPDPLVAPKNKQENLSGEEAVRRSHPALVRSDRMMIGFDVEQKNLPISLPKSNMRHCGL
jgi:hypothetical protein